MSNSAINFRAFKLSRYALHLAPDLVSRVVDSFSRSHLHIHPPKGEICGPSGVEGENGRGWGLLASKWGETE